MVNSFADDIKTPLNVADRKKTRAESARNLCSEAIGYGQRLTSGALQLLKELGEAEPF